VQSLYYRATLICQEQQVETDAIVALKHDLNLNACPTGFINFVINKHKRNVLLKKEVQPFVFISIFLEEESLRSSNLKQTDTILKLFAK
jgi:hypothetical protein